MGDQQDYGMRIYDPRVGRFLSVDPITKKYPWYTPYQFAGNTPIQAVDLDGKEPQSVVQQTVSYKTVTYEDPVHMNQIHKESIQVVNYKFTAVAAHLLSLVSGISEEDINKVHINNSTGTLVPAYNPNHAGGALTYPGDNGDYNINLTSNFFSHPGDNRTFNGYDFSNDAITWLDLTSHEVGHIQDIKEIGSNTIKYFSEFMIEYAQAGSHDGNAREKRADYGTNIFRGFLDFTNTKYGKQSLINLLNGNQKDGDKIKTLDKWFQEFSKSQEQTTNKAIINSSGGGGSNNQSSNTSGSQQGSSQGNSNGGS